jgi:hypothetical protein
VKMRKLLTSITALTLVGGVFLGTPARTRATAGEYWISTATVGDGTSCAAPTHEYDQADPTKLFNDILSAILFDVDANNYMSVTIAICEAEDGSTQRYELDTDTDPTNNLSGAEITIVGVQWDATSEADFADMDDVVIDGDTDWSPFEFDNADVNIGYLSIENAWDDNTGAAIHFEQDDESQYELYLEHVAIDNSVIDQGLGAGVYAEGSVTIVDSYFTANEVDNGVGGELYGGAVYVYGDLSVEHSEFDSNIADDGGAIYVEDGSLTISDDSWFYDNEARDGYGGAVYATVGSPDTVTISSSMFGDPENDSQGNYSLYGGGDLYIDGGAAEDQVADLTISNSAFYDGTVNDGNGGSIASVCAATVLTGVTIRDSYASNDGGGLWASDDEGCSSDYSVTISNSRFLGTEAGVQGGAISNDQDDAESLKDVIVKGSYFYQNEAGSGAAINLDHANLTVSKSSFIENQINSDDGGAMEFCENDNITISSSRFEGNLSSNDGGAIQVNCGLETMRLAGNSFIENEAEYNGGAISIEGFNGSSILIATSNKFLGNKAEDSGGVFSVYLNASARDSSLLRNLKRNTFRANRADSNGDGDGSGGILRISYDDFDGRSPQRRLESALRSGNSVQGARIGLIVQYND